MTSKRPSAVQVEQPDSDPPEVLDVSKETYLRLSVGQLVRMAMIVAAVVLAVAAVLPNLLPKKFTIATQTFVEESIDVARVDAQQRLNENQAEISKVNDDVRYIRARIETVDDRQVQALAAQEADRVTRGIGSPDRRVSEYARVYEAARRNLKAERGALEGVQLP